LYSATDEDKTVEEGNKSTLTAYLLWLLLGWTGIHHFYVHRDFQGSVANIDACRKRHHVTFLFAAFVWATTGGGFGMGLVYDMFRLDRYVSVSHSGPNRPPSSAQP
jgi:TM2 domain-containing membrane protein YozV